MNGFFNYFVLVETKTPQIDASIKSGLLADIKPVFANGDRFFGRKLAIMTEDMGPFVNYALTDIFGDCLAKDARQQALSIARESRPRYQAILRLAFPGRDWVIREEDISKIFRLHVEKFITQDPDVVIVMNDRYIAQELDTEFPDNIFRFSSTRTLQGTNTGTVKSNIMPRPGDPDFNSQIDQIEEKLQIIGKSLQGAHVVIADDVNVLSTTEDSIREMFTQRGARINTDESIYIYKVFIEEIEQARDRSRSAGLSEMRVASTEQRELTPLGGPLRSVGKYVALQQPAQAPFGDGGITRTNGFVHQTHLSRLQYELFLDVFGKIERVLQGAQRKDGSTFKYFTFADFRWMIPTAGIIKTHPHQIQDTLGLIHTRSLFGPAAAIRDYREKNNKVPQKLADIRLLDYIRLAIDEIREVPNPQISCVVTDIDGTQLKMVYADPTLKSFRYSELGKQVRQKVMELIVDVVGDATQADAFLANYDIEKPVKILIENPEFANALEGKYGNETLVKLKQRFISFYGENRGSQEYEIFLRQYNFLPTAYHVLRELTWGQIDYNQAYRPDEGKAKRFSTTVINQGGTLIFLTASPRIHAMQMLELTGQAELIKSGKAHLITVEDLYDPSTLEEQNKIVLFKALDQYDEDTAIDLFSRMATNGDDLQKQYVVYLKLRGKILNFLPLRHLSSVLSIGDQLHSDVRPAINAGGYGYLVNGPNDLDNVFKYADIGDEKSHLQASADSGDVEALRRLAQTGDQKAKEILADFKKKKSVLSSDIIFQQGTDESNRYNQSYL